MPCCGWPAAGEPPRGGPVVFLNGTSSAGKRSIAARSLRIVDEPWLHMPVDAFHAMRSGPPLSPVELKALLRRTWRGYHRAVAGMAAGGGNVVVDHVLGEEWRLRDCLDLFPPQDAMLVGMRCPREELERCARARGDRPSGPAVRQPELVHARGVYDLEVDTSRAEAGECTRRIKGFLPGRPRPTAFQRLLDGGR
ncbi:chloramphenicol phosphotransferase CPT family protein [Streptomyces caeni]|uniref:Chloramphenicol phosphotransferase CPT family protein n=1 Tax=Streptomyces caeni TaxID=2307231 RepID=A0ABW4IU79_9ACTN